MKEDTATSASAEEADVQNGASTSSVKLDGEDDLTAELTAARAQAEENYNKFLYAMADFENYKKRIERQLAEIALAGKKSVLTKILPVLDNLERDNDYLQEGGVFTSDLIETWIDYKRVNEVDPVRLRPHPYEFDLYYNI